MRAASSLALVVLAAGCGGSDGLTVEVSPRVSLADEPVRVRVEGAPPRSHVSITLESTDADGTVWRSSARYRADGDGVVDVARTAPVSGDYAALRSMELMGSLTPASGLGVYAWADARALTFSIQARTGKDEAAATFRRRLSTRTLERTRLSIEREGFVGEYVAPSGVESEPAVLVLGGSDGGLSVYARYIAEALAARGYPALALAYFAEPGLPQYLYRIPLEYFVGALRWLGRRPEVDPARVFTYGVSRGSEAALLLGATFPKLVYGVVASVPSSVANSGSWTIRGSDVPRAEIPAERIRGPVFAYCGTADNVWPSCPHAQALAGRLRRHRQPHELHVLRSASHAVGGLTPYKISSLTVSSVDTQAVAQVWPRLLAFLEEARR